MTLEKCEDVPRAVDLIVSADGRLVQEHAGAAAGAMLLCRSYVG